MSMVTVAYALNNSPVACLTKPPLEVIGVRIIDSKTENHHYTPFPVLDFLTYSGPPPKKIKKKGVKINKSS